MATTRGRLDQVNEVVLDQCDFFQYDGFSRVTGLTPSDLTSKFYFQNVLQPWQLTSGVGVTDAQVTSGRIYWSEVAGTQGIYSVRFRPNSVGYWRLVIYYPVGLQIAGQDYDVVTTAPVETSSGLTASFVNPNC